jgi:hypothetical protein
MRELVCGMTHLDMITSRSKANRVYLAAFVAMLSLATFVSASSVGMVIVERFAAR